MAFPRLRVLEDAEIAAVDAATRELLGRTGVDVHSPEARSVVTRAGADTLPGDVRVRFPEAVISEALRTAPRTVTLASRDGRHDLRIPDGAGHISTDGCGVTVWDLETGARRPSTQEDVAQLTRVGDALEEVDFQWPMVVAGDVPAEVHELTELATTFENTGKHVQHEALSGPEARVMVEMAATLVGGLEDLRRRPILSCVQCPVSPLTLEAGSTDAMLVLNRSGVPVAPLSMALAGGSSPVDLASTLVTSNAEILASICISQAVAPGSPVIWAISSGPLDMRTGSFAAGSPELGLLGAAGVQMARHYGLPALVAGFACDADSVGFQAGVEKLGTGLMAVLAGADLVSGLGGLDSDSCMSVEQLVLDAEVVAYARRAFEGFRVEPESLQLETLMRLGSRGNYLKEPHTLAHFRKRLWQPRFLRRDGYVEGSPAEARLRDRIKTRVRELLRTPIPSPLEADSRRRLWELADRRAVPAENSPT